ncbi:hypothetical protein BJ912DRAFT_132440 [Pholiota molesta]|nr:hypothetical protein BJ912DRAFT_132440 [Pholiota molesta]
MHFSKLITTFIVITTTGVLASPSFHEKNTDLRNAGASYSSADAGNEAALFDSEIHGFSEVPKVEETPMECHLWRCLGRSTFHRRCPKGYNTGQLSYCGFRRSRARCRRFRPWLTNSEESAGGPGQGGQREAGLTSSKISRKIACFG